MKWRDLLTKIIRAAGRVVFYNRGISYRPPSAKNWKNYLAYESKVND